MSFAESCAKNAIVKGSRILMAAGDVSISQHYCGHLSQAGYHIERVYTGLDCFNRVRTRMPDALVLVGQLPWGNLEWLLEFVHSTGYLARLRTVFIGEAESLASLASSIMERIAVVPMSNTAGPSTTHFGVEFPHYNARNHGPR